MKWTYNWLKDYLKTDLSAREIADTLTRTGLEVEELIEPVAPIFAKIVECKAHENSDHLHVLMVDDGSDNLRQVVCGAPNVRVGLVSALARPGCVIGGNEIVSGKIRGVLSDGMMCSARELGLGTEHDGILELDADSVIGAPVMTMETVFDAGITPNRPDYLSVRGIARDLAAANAGQYIVPADNLLNSVSGTRQVKLETSKCTVYQMCEISNVNITDSDSVIKSRLSAIGINPKNAAIDATNYICYDMAQPMHCFDADKITGDIIVRNAKPMEDFTDLFGGQHKLNAADIVISDAQGILACAGVIGGARGGVSSDTKNIILESAYFDSVSVRKTAKRLGVSTDASYRYERGIDPRISAAALSCCADIIMSACGGKIINVYTAGTISDKETVVKYSPDLFLKKTGLEMDSLKQLDILKSLGFNVHTADNYWDIIPTSARVDIKLPEHIVSELLRLYGYDNMAAQAKPTSSRLVAHNDYDLRFKTALAARGLNEVKTFGFSSSKTHSLISDKSAVSVANPITADLDIARGTLLSNLLTSVSDNEKRGFSDLNMFELGTVFDGDATGAQHSQICIVRTGVNAPKHWQGRNRAVDIYDLKADLISLMQGQSFTVSSDNAPLWAHPFRYGAIMQGKNKICEFGQLHPSVARALKIKTNVCIAIIDNIENLPATRIGKEMDLSDFQPIKRDFAFIVDADFPAEKILGVAKTQDVRISDIVVFDAFDMDNGKKSIAFQITIIPTDNMTDGDLMEIQNKIIAAVEKKCDGKIRDK